MARYIGRATKQSGETLDYPVDFGPWFEGRVDAPASFTVTADPGITIAGSARAGNVVSVSLSGGTDGQRYKVTVRLTTTASPPIVREADFLITIRDV